MAGQTVAGGEEPRPGGDGGGRVMVENPFLAVMRDLGIGNAAPRHTPREDSAGGPVAPAGDPRAARYATAALEDECRTLAATGEGARNPTLFKASANIAEFVAAGHLDHDAAADKLADAARRSGLGGVEIGKTLRSGFRSGLQNPREVTLTDREPVAEAYTLDGPGGGAGGQLGAHSGQLRIAERFVNTYAWRLLYVHGIGWHYWTGRHWCADRNGKAHRRVVKLLKQLRHESVEMAEKERDRLLADVKRCESAAGIDGVLAIARRVRPMTAAAGELDANPMLFNATNGTLNLEAGRMQPHDPQDLITKCAGAEVDLEAHSTTWEEFLATVLPDEAVRSYLQRVMGVSMLGRVREHILPILTGTGGNGKSVFVDAVMEALGSYGITVDPQLIVQARHERHGTFMADLQGARLVVTSETNEGEKLAASTVKRLTGGDKIRANRMRENPFEFEPSHTLLFVTNHKPQVSADDSAIWRRLSVVPFDVTIPAERQDRRLPEKLREHLSAVLSWCFRGWLAYHSSGLNPPPAVQSRTDEYRGESDPLGQFIDEECVTDEPLARVKAKALFERWATWAMRNGQPPITQTDFGRRLAARGFERKRDGRGVYQYVGIATRDEEGGTL